MTEDSRTTRRPRVLKDGKIVTKGLGSVVDYSVRDITAAGARIRCKSQKAIPEEFELLVLSDNWIRPVKVMWRRGDEAGVQFTGEARRAPPRKW